MKVFKFGGASVQDIGRIENVAAIINSYQGEDLMIIVSAMGKTTNALEKVAETFFEHNKEQALQLFNVVKQQHTTIAKYLLVTHYNICYAQLNDFFTEVEWLLHDKPVREYDYYYDQIVCLGELLSTCIVSNYLNEAGIANTWLDVRDIVRTDDNFRDASIDWKRTKQAIDTAINFSTFPIYITQGFIGSTDENESTTLGREGSDYSAAIFANLLDAESLTIWKDVEGVMNADPKTFPEAQILKELSFDEVIEMAYYGAQVIHPKTIKPLQNKGIPLHVKCFLNPALPGTTIYKKQVKNLPPIFVVKQAQVLVHLHSQDFSFVGDEPLIALYKIFKDLKIKPNLIQTGAISLQLCMDGRKDKVEQLASAASAIFDVQVETGLELLTIRHYNDSAIDKMTKGKTILLSQKTTDTLQVLYRA
ncbi:aspartate kinase [Parasediminibacterium sp. JCM 36343]|uniref:aspartate kinase n=1 Tax=Parasediminibacterium sp. JCM 36343 TaxID=3374279 RepID=UPI0039798296